MNQQITLGIVVIEEEETSKVTPEERVEISEEILGEEVISGVVDLIVQTTTMQIAIIVEVKDTLLVNVHHKNNQRIRLTKPGTQKQTPKEQKVVMETGGKGPRKQKLHPHLPLRKFRNHHGQQLRFQRRNLVV